MRIVFDPRTLHQSRSGSITAVVYFDFGNGRSFPCEGWNDFVVVITNWWTHAFEQAVSNGREQKLRFMDGPYWIRIVSQADTLLLVCVEDRRGAGPVCEVLVDTDQLRGELVGLARSVSAACREAGIESPDLNTLRSLLPN